jgi:hypothetical protein
MLPSHNICHCIIKSAMIFEFYKQDIQHPQWNLFLWGNIPTE